MAIFETLYSESLNLELNSSDSNTLFTTARRKQAINDAAEEFADLTECLIRQSSITVSCNTTEYTLLGSTDITRLAKQGLEYRVRSSGGSTARWLTWLSGDQFAERPIEWRNKQTVGWRQSTTVGTPSGYYRRTDGGNLFLGLDIPPDVGSSEAAEILLPYVARPVVMTSTSDVPFTVNSSVRTDLTVYHRALPHYAAYTLLPLLGDEAGSQAQLQKFMGYVARYLQNLRPKGGTMRQFGHNYLRASRMRGRAGDRQSLVPPSQWS